LSRGLTYLGNNTEIIFGFIKSLLSLANKFYPCDFIFCWDSKSSKRKEINPDYKRHRHDSKTEEQKLLDAIAYNQFNEIRTFVLPELGFKNIFIQEGYEGDDLIARIVLDHEGLYNSIVVVSSDNDLYQLLDYCSLYDIFKKSIINKNMFLKEYSIEPTEWIRVKQIAGCNGDEVKGVNGVGIKKAIKYIKGELNQGKVFDSIEDSKKLIRMNRRLVKLPLSGTMKCELKKDDITEEKFKRICIKYNFKSLFGKEKEWVKKLIQ